MSANRYVRGVRSALTENFDSVEFDCRGTESTSNCGCTATHLESELFRKLQILRNRTGKPITISSGYRCTKHNQYVGGASQSYHLKGMAADVYCVGYTPEQLAKLAQDVGFRGIGMYNGSAGSFVHVDVRDKTYYWKNTTGSNTTTTTHGGEKRRYEFSLGSATLRIGLTGTEVSAVQERLDGCGYGLEVDGKYGEKTAAAVRAFQRAMLLDDDGIVGGKTRAALNEVVR